MSNSSATPWIIAHQAPLSLGFPRQEYWSGLPFPLPGDLPDTGIESASPTLTGRFFTTEPPGKPIISHSVQFSSVAQSCPILCDPEGCSMPGFPVGSVVKNPPADAGDAGSILDLGRSPGEGNGNSLLYSCLGNPMDRIA